MIGDRIDADIAPAKKLGMRTIWVNMSPKSQRYCPEGELEELYIESLKKRPHAELGQEMRG